MSQFKKQLRWFDMETPTQKDDFKSLYDLAKNDPNCIVYEDFGDCFIFIGNKSKIEA